ncbi:hypothetical protein KR76_00102 [Pimelobacter simplex]|uniref:Uncharacterized protein n=1 Tax=Nocardioides simplex TaxID=2045 RepID=A0A0C5XH67_NOCSI|nr:hypothetical protein KR76_00102 [Pimelobacter simplex]SFM72224.1 hypothetical protein SAMN05421671_3143 [Pimelobacter simplex]
MTLKENRNPMPEIAHLEVVVTATAEVTPAPTTAPSTTEKE